MVQSDNNRRQVHLDATGVDLPRTLDVCPVNVRWYSALIISIK
jgi:hypothetical protein